MPRKYIKKSPWWDQRKKNAEISQVATASMEQGEAIAAYEIELLGKPLVSKARSDYINTTNSTHRRRNEASKAPIDNRFSNIRCGLLPYQQSADGVDVRDAILLCQKAYANIALFRNVVDMMAEFSNSEIYLEGGSQKSRDFFRAWLKKVSIWKLADQYFREYFRGGNIFMFRVDGKFNEIDFRNMIRLNGAKTNNIPLRYIMLNPYDIVAKNSSYYSEYSYEKLLSQYDLERLKKPISQEDKDVFDSLPEEAKKKILNSEYRGDGITIPLPTEKIHFSFYKKQDYEPFAIPFGFPVLGDLNMKQEFKNMDAAILRTVENVILLITMGAEKAKGGINYKNISAMQNLFRNESVGRVLVADYTTKAEFIIPDLNKVLGPDKYEVLNRDIKDGLQNIMLTDDTHSTADIKSKVFLDRLKEARQQFLSEFLQQEVDRVGRNMGFRMIPKLRFKEIDMRDDIQLMRVGTRLMEIGVITPDQGMEFFKTGQLPNKEEMEEAQSGFVKNREKGFYNPLVGGVPETPPPLDPNAAQRAATKTPLTKGRPLGSNQENKMAASVRDIEKTVLAAEGSFKGLERIVKRKFKLKSLSREQGLILDDVFEKVICSKERDDWDKTIKACAEDISETNKLSVIPDILEISKSFELDRYSAALLYHSRKYGI